MKLSIATIVTEKTIKEFQLMKYSLEQYHDVEWFISCDVYVENNFTDGNKNYLTFRMIDNDDADHNIASDEQKDRWMSIMMTKFDICKTVLETYKRPYVMFLDCDMLFVNPIEDSLLDLMHQEDIDAMICPHMTNVPEIENKHGYYNAGMFAVRNPKFIEAWQDVAKDYKKLGMYFEQQPLEFIHRNFYTLNLPIQYNLGWWRFNAVHTKHRLLHLKLKPEDKDNIYIGSKPAINFHMHCLRDLHYENYGQFLVDRVFGLIEKSKNKQYQNILNKYMELNKNEKSK